MLLKLNLNSVRLSTESSLKQVFALYVFIHKGVCFCVSLATGLQSNHILCTFIKTEIALR